MTSHKSEADHSNGSDEQKLAASESGRPSQSIVNEDEGLNTDDRDKGDWKSRYPQEARKAIRYEAIYVGVVLFVTLLALLLAWRGVLYSWAAGDCTRCSIVTFDRYIYFFIGGVLGGTLFGIKYLYKVVARNRWTEDRRLWRIFSPFISGGLAIAVAGLTDSGILGLNTKASSGASYFSLGFIAGYFADSALAKMQEIAETIFGSTDRHKHDRQG